MGEKYIFFCFYLLKCNNFCNFASLICTKVSNTYTYTLNVTSYVEVPYSVVNGFYDKTQFYTGVNGVYKPLTQDTILNPTTKYYKLVNSDVTYQYTTGEPNDNGEYKYFLQTFLFTALLYMINLNFV